MQQPAQVTFRGVERDAPTESVIRERIDLLGRYFERIVGCRVVVDQPHHRRQSGNIYRVEVHLALPGSDIHVNREPELDPSHTDLSVAVHDAFDTVERRLKSRAERLRNEVKRHEDPAPIGHIARIFADRGFGFIETLDGREVYFHRNAVAGGGFDELKVGTPIRYRESLGEEGPQALTVQANERSESTAARN